MFFKKNDIHSDFQRLSTDLEALKNEILHLKTAHKLLRNEWEDTYEKLTKQVERFRKRALVLEPEAPKEPSGELNRHHLLRNLKEQLK